MSARPWNKLSDRTKVRTRILAVRLNNRELEDFRRACKREGVRPATRIRELIWENS